MKTVLYPAIALMNRLSFGMKFGLISVLFFLPLLITSFYLVRDAYRQFSDTRIELQSLTLLGSGLQIRRGLESLNDLLQINAVIGQSGKAGDLEARIADAAPTTNRCAPSPANTCPGARPRCCKATATPSPCPPPTSPRAGAWTSAWATVSSATPGSSPLPPLRGGPGGAEWP